LSEMIDTHIHITPPEIIENERDYCQRDDYFSLLCSNPKNEFITAEEMADKMDELGLKKAVVFGFAFKDNELCQKVNDYTIKAVEDNPEDFIGFCVVNPASEGAVEELKRCKNAGLRGIGELFPAGQNFDITSGEDMAEICSFAAEEGWPILVHVNEPVGHDYAGKTEIGIEEGVELAGNFPQNKFIFAHWGGGLPFYELMPEIKDKLVNVYYDIAASPFLYDDKIFEVIRALGIIDRVLLGSDYPLISPRVYEESIKETELGREDVEKILWKNAEGLLL